MSSLSDGGLFDSYHKHPVIIGNTRIPIFFRFIQNPNYLSFSLKKEYEQTRTIGGYVFEHWGKKPTMIKGKVLLKKDEKVANFVSLNTKTTNFGIEDGTINPELMMFKTLFNIDQRKMNDSGLFVKNALSSVASSIPSGVSSFLSNVSGSSSETEPSQASIAGYLSTMTDTIIYYKDNIYTGFFVSMNFAEDGKTPFYNEVTFEFLCTGMTSDWIDTMLTQTSLGKSILSLWGASTSVFTLGSLLSNVFKKF